MAEPNHLPSGDDDDPDDDDPVAPGALPLGFEHLGWAPTWRDRLDAVVGAASPPRLAAWSAGALVAAVVVAVVLLRGPAPPPPELTLPLAGAAGDPGRSTTTSTTAPGPVEVVVHAAGAVSRPGVYRLAAGARVADLLDAAGGPVAGADLDRLNLAAPLADGDRVYVPVVGQDVPPVVGGGSTAAGERDGGATAGPVDLNSATLDELDTLPGVGPATAQAILDERERRGGFRSVEDLLDVRGIGEAKLAALRDLVSV